MTVSGFDHPWLSALVGDDKAAALFSVEADLAAMVRFENVLAEAQAQAGLIPSSSFETIRDRLAAFRPDRDKLAQGTRRDGVVVPELLRQMRMCIGGAAARDLHKGATSQDVIDTSLALRLGQAAAILDSRLAQLDEALAGLEARDGEIEVMAHTRMQAALPVTARRKIESWRHPLVRARGRLAEAADGVAMLHLGGPVGNRAELGPQGDEIAAAMGAALGLRAETPPRHSERDGIVALANALALLTGSLGKMGQDIALAAQSEIGEIRIAGGGGSSAMAHKSNPVGAEALVALARFNATLSSGMNQAMVHENERSGAAWTLEWLLLPQMVVAAAGALRTALDLVGSIRFRSVAREN